MSALPAFWQFGGSKGSQSIQFMCFAQDSFKGKPLSQELSCSAALRLTPKVKHGKARGAALLQGTAGCCPDAS